MLKRNKIIVLVHFQCLYIKLTLSILKSFNFLEKIPLFLHNLTSKFQRFHVKEPFVHLPLSIVHFALYSGIFSIIQLFLNIISVKFTETTVATMGLGTGGTGDTCPHFTQIYKEVPHSKFHT